MSTLRKERCTSSKYSEVIIFTPAKFSEVRWFVAPLKGGQRIGSLSPDGRNASSAIVAAKAFLFVCRVGLRYTKKECPVNWFAGVGQALLKRAWAGVGRGLLNGFVELF